MFNMVRITGRVVAARSLSSVAVSALALFASGCRYDGVDDPVGNLGGTVTPGNPEPSEPSQPSQPDGPDQPSEPDPVTQLPAAGIGGNLFAADDTVLEVRLTLEEADRQSLELDGDDEEYLPAAAALSVPAGQARLARIGVRHKGAYSLHHCFDDRTGIRSYAQECGRLSYKLKFDEYTADARFDGLKRLNLHSSTSDVTRLRELLAYGLFRDFGVVAPRTALAKVYVNDEYEGLFIAVEEIDGRFAKAHFPDSGDGNLYKELWPSAGLDASDAVDALRTNEDIGDVSQFLAFSQAIQNTAPASFAADMQSWVDIDHTLRYVAVDRALKNWDGIMAFYSPTSPHNFYWYHDVEASGRFQLIPWDMDNTSWAFDPYMSPQSWVSAPPVPDWNAEPSTCSPRPVWDRNGDQTIMPPRCDHFLDMLAETHFTQFQSIATELLDGPFAVDALLARVDRLSAALEPIVAEDPLLSLSQWRTERNNFKTLLERSHDRFAGFAARGLMQESAPGEEP
jgi:spore coat protein H